MSLQHCMILVYVILNAAFITADSISLDHITQDVQQRALFPKISLKDVKNFYDAVYLNNVNNKYQNVVDFFIDTYFWNDEMIKQKCYHDSQCKKLIQQILRNPNNDTIINNALLQSSKMGNYLLIEILLNNDANIETQDATFYNHTSLLCAVYYQHINAVTTLLEHGANVSAINSFSWDTPLHVAVMQKNLNIVTKLLNHSPKPNVDAKRYDGETALHWASKNGYQQIAAVLIQYGASVNIADKNGKTALHFASMQNQIRIIILLLNNGSNIEAKDNNGYTPLHSAIEYGYCQEITLKTLLQYNATIDTKDNHNETPLHRSAAHGQLNEMIMLLNNEADIEVKNSDGLTPLMLATKNIASYSNPDIVITLLKYGANVNSQCRFNMTAIHYSLKDHYYDWDNSHVDELSNVTITLLNYGANVIMQDAFGFTPLHYASYSCKVPQNIYKMILTRMIENIDIKNTKGHTALHLAVWNGCINEMMLLLKNGANINTKDNDNNTPLHPIIATRYLVNENIVQIVRLLLKNGADVHARNFNMETPLIALSIIFEKEKLQTRLGHLQQRIKDIASLLLDHGADMTAMDSQGKTCLDYAPSLFPNHHYDTDNIILNNFNIIKYYKNIKNIL